MFGGQSCTGRTMPRARRVRNKAPVLHRHPGNRQPLLPGTQDSLTPNAGASGDSSQSRQLTVESLFSVFVSLNDDLNRLDRLIDKHAKPSESANLKGQSVRIREHVEALIADNRRLTNELKVLGNTSNQRIEDLAREVMRLEDKAAQPEKARSVADDLPHDSQAILTMLATLDSGGATVSEVGSHFNHSDGNAQHYLELLRSRKLVLREPGVMGGRRPRPARYRILPAGREWLKTHGWSP
jgi:hypothetical protein